MTEFEARRMVIEEARSWIGTPFRDCADVKGRNGCVDCAMLLTRVFVDTGVAAKPFDPRPYSPQVMLHSDRETFLEWIVGHLDMRETTDPKPADICVFRSGRTFSHGGIVLSAEEFIHAYKKEGAVLISRFDDTSFREISPGRKRPVRFFDPWAGR